MMRLFALFRSGSKLQKKPEERQFCFLPVFFDRGVMGLEQNPGEGYRPMGCTLLRTPFEISKNR